MLLLYGMTGMPVQRLPARTPGRRLTHPENTTVSEKTINAAVLGYGGAFSMGLNHLKWMESAGFTPYAACDLDAARVAAATVDFPGIRTFTDHREMLADEDVDIVVQILPHNLHACVNLDIVNAGKHCVSEKPFTLTTAEADACIDAAHANNVVLTVFHNRRFDADHLAMLEVIERGEIGEPFHIEAGMGSYGEPPDWWRADKAISGGNMYDWGVHFIDWVLRLIPDPIENVTAFYHDRVWPSATNEDQTQAVIRFTTGKYVDVRISSIDAAPRPKFRILGTEGAIVMEHGWPASFTVYRVANGARWQREVSFGHNRYPDPGAAYYRNLADHLRHGVPLAVTAESARRNIAVIEAAERSARSHQAEPVSGE